MIVSGHWCWEPGTTSTMLPLVWHWLTTADRRSVLCSSKLQVAQSAADQARGAGGDKSACSAVERGVHKIFRSTATRVTGHQSDPNAAQWHIWLINTPCKCTCRCVQYRRSSAKPSAQPTQTRHYHRTFSKLCMSWMLPSACAAPVRVSKKMSQAASIS